MPNFFVFFFYIIFCISVILCIYFYLTKEWLWEFGTFTKDTITQCGRCRWPWQRVHSHDTNRPLQGSVCPSNIHTVVSAFLLWFRSSCIDWLLIIDWQSIKMLAFQLESFFRVWVKWLTVELIDWLIIS